jgi:hypothetical protein
MDPHRNESVVELNRDTVKLWREAKAAVVAWEKAATHYEMMLKVQLGDAFAGMIDDEKVITWRPQNKYATASLRRDYPDLTEHFMESKLVTDINMERFAAQHPDIADQYRVRSFRDAQ